MVRHSVKPRKGGGEGEETYEKQGKRPLRHKSGVAFAVVKGDGNESSIDAGDHKGAKTRAVKLGQKKVGGVAATGATAEEAVATRIWVKDTNPTPPFKTVAVNPDLSNGCASQPFGMRIIPSRVLADDG